MRWFTPIVIVALLAAGASRPAQASLRSAAPSMRAPAGPTKLAPRRTAILRGAVADRRSHIDEVVVAPRVLACSPHRSAGIVATPVPSPLPVLVRAVVAVARGPPSGRAVTLT